MSVQVENLEKSTAKLTVEVPAEELDKAIQQAYMKQKKNFSMPGFRKGKVPKQLIEKMYGPEVFYEDAANFLLQANYPEAAKESELKIITRPVIDVTQIEKGKDFIFTAEVGVYPEVELGQYKGVEIPIQNTEVTEADIEAELKAEQEKNTKAGSLTKSSGEGVFADAVDGVTSTGGSGSTAAGVQIGTPVSVSSDATLKPLGTFRITHYCPCSICCGPWANGITSTGVTATTNRTIAVDPSQIPYGSKVVINGQVYVAEDCGGAIRTNCIDVYVATHSEAEQKGVFYTEVYLLQ